MKNLFKVAAVAVLSLGFGVAANAQQEESPRTGAGTAQIEASAQVLGSVEVIAGLPLVFGQVMPGFNKYISLGGSAGSNSEGTVNSNGVSQGTFYVSAQPGASVILDFTLPSKLVEEDDSEKEMDIVFNQGLEGPTNTIAWAVAGEEDGDADVLVEIPDGELGGHLIPVFPANEVSVSDANKNAITVFIGGMVKPSSTQARGSYKGVISLTAAYN